MWKETVPVTTKKFGMFRVLVVGVEDEGNELEAEAATLIDKERGYQLPSTGTTTDSTGHTELVTVLSAVEGDSETRTLESSFC